MVSAIDRDRAEVTVAPLTMRLGASIGAAAPALASAVSRRLGSERIAADIAAGQRDKR